MSIRSWKIRGYDGNRQVFERAIPLGSLSDAQVTMLLQRLASRHLTDEEVVSASLRRNAVGYAPHLEVQKNPGGKYAIMTTGSGHHYAAVVEDDY